MYGDYSRGHEPDRKRGREYRRVLLQQGRPLLDSDVAALVDSAVGGTRAAVRGFGCSAGSPDLGFLVTPGRLICVFAEAAGALSASGAVDAWLDHRHRFAGRYPALQLATGATPATVTLPALQALDAHGAHAAGLWARVESPEAITVNGTTVSLSPSSPDEPVRVEFNTGSATLSPVVIALPAHTQVWLFLLEQDALAGDDPVFSVAPGTYHVDGLIADARGGGVFPEVSFPSAAGFPWEGSPLAPAPLGGLLAPPLTPGTRLVAYLETWERHISAIEDPGIREEALGGTDTTARAQLLGQVKIASVSGLNAVTATAAAQARAAFRTLVAANGALTVEVRETTPTTDPCALPDVAGYSGADNRLYRFEVHVGGTLGALRLKWSRDNGSELFSGSVDPSTRNLLFTPGTALAAGDIVEVLSDVVDLGDDALASVGTGGFVPARRAVGQLAQLAAVPSADPTGQLVFRLVDPANIGTSVPLDAKFRGTVKLRRWHGILAPGGAAGPHVLEDGITVKLSGSGFRAGDYWQYEARVRRENANGVWRPEPHGPERRFAPLALLRWDSATEPLRLLAWLDERFSRVCELDADDVSFTGARVGSDSDTVQEALEELFERPPEIIDASCGELIIRPENDPQAVFDTIPAGGDRRICIHPGVWNLTSAVVVQGKGDLVISGAGDATRFAGQELRFVNCGQVRIQDMTVNAGAGRAIVAESCAGLDLQRVNAIVPDHPTRQTKAIFTRATGEVRIRDCHVTAGNWQTGVLVVNAQTVDIEANTITSPQHATSFQLTDQALGMLTRRVITGGWHIGVTEEANNELLVGSPNVVVERESDRPGLRKFIAHLEQFGNQFITFYSPQGLNSTNWFVIFSLNGFPAPGNSGPDGADLLMRRLRWRLVNTMLGRPNGATLGGPLQSFFVNQGTQLVAQANFTAGGQGIVVAGLGTVLDRGSPQPNVLVEPRPDVRISGNRISGFIQGIHVGTSQSRFRGVTYRATITDNVVHMRVPSYAVEPRGIFVGSVYHLRLEGNSVEVRTPDRSGWNSTPATEAIRVWGDFGPLIRVRDNNAVGTRLGAVAHAINVDQTPGHSPVRDGWSWLVADNTHVGVTSILPQTRNW